MEKKKIKLNTLKVKSFVTKINSADALTIQGGDRTDNQGCFQGNSNNPACLTFVQGCLNTANQFCTQNVGCPTFGIVCNPEF